MNIFEEFMTLREVDISPGAITMDKQRVIILPINFIGKYTLKYHVEGRDKELYYAMKKGMINYGVPIGKTYGLTYKEYLDRWVKYCAFGGWGKVSYTAIETSDMPRGIVEIKDLPLHIYLKNNGVSETSSDPLFDGLIAGSASTAFNKDIDVLETKCICAGDKSCIYYWGSKDYIIKLFPDLSKKRFSDNI